MADIIFKVEAILITVEYFISKRLILRLDTRGWMLEKVKYA